MLFIAREAKPMAGHSVYTFGNKLNYWVFLLAFFFFLPPGSIWSYFFFFFLPPGGIWTSLS